MMPNEPIIDMMRRTMANLRFIEKHAREDGLYEVTQLVNSFLAALAHPWEEYKEQLNSMTIEDAISNGWPKLQKERVGRDSDPTSLGDLLRLVRNSFAHGNIDFLPNQPSEITHLRFWNCNRQGNRTWGTIATVDDLRMFLKKFVELASGLTESDLESRTGRRSA